jgi:FtsZ-interacting cell division protein ZipA
MAKTLKEIPTRSASAATKPIGVAMTLDDLDVDVRSQTVAESLERVMPSPTPSAPSQAAASPPITTSLATVSEPTQAVEPSIAPEPQKHSEEKKKTASQMLSTPIPAALKRRLNGLRLQHSISTAFVVEIALNEFFGDRSDDAIAADLQARGGRLRRN